MKKRIQNHLETKKSLLEMNSEEQEELKRELVDLLKDFISEQILVSGKEGIKISLNAVESALSYHVNLTKNSINPAELTDKLKEILAAVHSVVLFNDEEKFISQTKR